jgi:hypothetical protein
MTFLLKISETKTFFGIFCKAFLILKNILLQPQRTYFHFYKKGFLSKAFFKIKNASQKI